MAAINWGYAINKPRVIDIDSNNLRKSDEILREMGDLAELTESESGPTTAGDAVR